MKPFLALLSAVLISLPLPPRASAQDASGWVDHGHSRVRLIAGGAPEAGVVDLGIQIDLEPGWKTYWRTPGDSGIPPSFDWSRSADVAAADVAWPAPVRFDDPFGQSIGYRDEVVLPVRVKLSEPATEPVRIALDLHYAVCSDICVPVRTALDLELDPETPVKADQAAAIARYAALVPQPATRADGPRVAAARAEARDDGLELVIDIAGSTPAAATEVLVEGPPGVYVGMTREAPGEGGDGKRFTARVDGADGRDDLRGKQVTVTILEGEIRLEQVVTVQ